MTFDPFGDFDSLGYLRNYPGFKDISQVKALEHASFQINMDRAINTLATVKGLSPTKITDETNT